MARTQEQRRTETRARLLAAAAAAFAERGVDGASVDAIADAADRTSGSVYAHFGSKEGLLFELVEEWKNQVATTAAAEMLAARDLDAGLAALWRNVADPAGDGGEQWLRLEHELWRWATREGNDDARQRLAARYRDAASAIGEALTAWAEAGVIHPPSDPETLAPLVIALLVGLEMHHRLDPAEVREADAVAGLRALLGANGAERPKRRRRS